MRLVLFLDHACNLRCTYCYNGDKFSRPMPLATAEAALDLALGTGEPLGQVGFFGGEPLLRFELLQEITRAVRARTAAREKPTTLVVTTNAALLTADRLPWLAENRFHVGASLDGCPQAHDACRVHPDGRGSHAEVVAGVRRVLDAGLPLRTISVIDPANVDLLAESFEHLLGLGVREMHFSLNYEGDWSPANRARFQAALGRLADAYVAAWRRGVTFKLDLLDGKIVTHVKGGFACTDRCDFGCHELAVSPTGRLYPCDRLIGQDDRPEVVIGDVWQGVDTAARDRLIDEKNRVLADCATCALLPRCMHWCGCVNFAMTGSVGEVSGLLCWFEATVIEAADRVAETLYAEKNPLFLKRFYGRLLGA
jgi:uncharacterized protein